MKNASSRRFPFLSADVRSAVMTPRLAPIQRRCHRLRREQRVL